MSVQTLMKEALNGINDNVKVVETLVQAVQCVNDQAMIASTEEELQGIMNG